MITAESTPGKNSMKNPSDPIGNKTRDLSACSAVPQPTSPPRTPLKFVRQSVVPSVFH